MYSAGRLGARWDFPLGVFYLSLPSPGYRSGEDAFLYRFLPSLSLSYPPLHILSIYLPLLGKLRIL